MALIKFFASVMKSPLLWGCTTCAIFYTLLHKGVINNELIVRYFAGHPVEYFEAILFFVGLSALIIKGFDVMRQRGFTSKGLFGAVSKPVPPLAATPMLNQLDTLSSSKQNSYLIGRFRSALSYVSRNGSAEGLEDELKYLSDMDSAAMHQSYALSRIIVWAIPILGFLGTVIGITVAMGELGVSVDGGDSLKKMLAGLSVAFDTTALALALSMVLMFTQYVVEGRENDLISTVDKIASRELAGRFEVIPNTPDGELTSLRRMLESMVESVKEMIAHQSAIWQEAFSVADSQWQNRLEQTGDALRRNLAAALNDVLSDSISRSVDQTMSQQNQAFLSGLAQIQDQTADKMKQSAEGFTDSVSALASAQKEIALQTAQLSKINAAAENVTELQKTMSQNLNVLAGARSFENAAVNLAAAVEMLASRMNQPNVRIKDAA